MQLHIHNPNIRAGHFSRHAEGPSPGMTVVSPKLLSHLVLMSVRLPRVGQGVASLAAQGGMIIAAGGGAAAGMRRSSGRSPGAVRPQLCAAPAQSHGTGVYGRTVPLATGDAPAYSWNSIAAHRRTGRTRSRVPSKLRPGNHTCFRLSRARSRSTADATIPCFTAFSAGGPPATKQGARRRERLLASTLEHCLARLRCLAEPECIGTAAAMAGDALVQLSRGQILCSAHHSCSTPPGDAE